ncbi:leucine-rich repeat-containing protein 4C-like [Anthonomus grandis grandis]|uniref:leucine-rich repeat-containing protein 4C-like n=1 Tax=Anthonomus grandis grandis TaxID=2921223 RepID=UPI002165B65F|nr:leucine-rich repeat-containing protein 4C-like [Anthonomus grandis grandis]
MGDEKAHPMWITLLQIACLLYFISSVDCTICPSGCTCENEILKTNCSGAGLSVVPIQLNPELHVMDISRNKITQLHYTFTFYEKLQYLNVSNNRVKVIGSGNFKTQRELMILDLSNNLIDILYKSCFEGLLQLKELNLSNNRLEKIEQSAFKDLSNLTILRMDGNQLDYLEEKTFKETPNLKALFLNDNSFIEIPLELTFLTHLRILSMSRNLIEIIEGERMPNLQELHSLILDQNLIQNITFKGFDNMLNISHLDLSDNNLTTLPTLQLSKLHKLVYLRLNGNKFTKFTPVAFRGLFHLKFLMLNRLETLETIDSRAFVDNINLEKVSMDYNYKVKSLPSRLFHGNRKLRYLSIRYNAIRFLVASHFPLDQLEHLRVGGNPLECNCSMGWLWMILRESKPQNHENSSDYSDPFNDSKILVRLENELKLDINDIICESPEEMHNRKLISATESQMDCSMSWAVIISITLTTIIIVGAIFGLFFFLPRKSSNRRNTNWEPSRIIKSNYNTPPPLPQPQRILPNIHDHQHEKYISMPQTVHENQHSSFWDPYEQGSHSINCNIYEQLNDHRSRPHIVYV